MKRFLIISGCLFLLSGLFYDLLPLELLGGLSNMFSGNSHTYFRLVPGDDGDQTQVVLLALGATLVLAGLLWRSSKEPG